jgi:hypothetical protein
MKLNPIVLVGPWDVTIKGGIVDMPFNIGSDVPFIASPVPERLAVMTRDRFERSWDHANRYQCCTITINFDQRRDEDLPNWVDPESDWLEYKVIEWKSYHLGESVHKKIYAIPPRRIDISIVDDEKLERMIDYAFSRDTCQCGDGDCCGRTPKFVDLTTIKREKNGMVSFKMRGSQHV